MDSHTFRHTVSGNYTYAIKPGRSKPMTDRDKAAQLLARLVMMHRPMTFKEPEDIQYGCSSKELDFYYFWICKGGKL